MNFILRKFTNLVSLQVHFEKLIKLIIKQAIIKSTTNKQ